MEFIRGTKVTDIEGLRARRISPVKVNRLLVRAYLKQLLEDGFFHADPHPGNLAGDGHGASRLLRLRDDGPHHSALAVADD